MDQDEIPRGDPPNFGPYVFKPLCSKDLRVRRGRVYEPRLVIRARAFSASSGLPHAS